MLQIKIKSDISKQKDVFPLALLLFTIIFLSLTISAGLYVVDVGNSLGIIFFVGLELLFIGLAHDLTTTLLSLLLPPQKLPKMGSLSYEPPVALLMTVCDDVVAEVFEPLRYQTYSNYDVFILDDSQDENEQAIVDQSGHRVLRRNTRRGYKAGNLNNWLDKYGSNYKYIVILDNDSLIPPHFVRRMVEYAEHPQNSQVAGFQSKILTWNRLTPLQRVLGVLAPLNMYILERVANRTNTLLSFGHNILVRTDNVIRVGGFHENVTAEDTVLSLMLSAQGFTVKLVDVISYDTEPQDVLRFTRRAVRWAKQTVELFHLPWEKAAFRLKLTLCFKLYNYLIYVIYFGLLLLTAWTPIGSGDYSPHDFMAAVLINKAYLAPWFIALLTITSVWVAQIILRLFLVTRSGISTRSFMLHSLLSTSLMYSVFFPIIVGMFRTALGARTVFVPTNVRTSEASSLSFVLRQMLPMLIYSTLILIGIVLRNPFVIFGLNSLWLLLLSVAPLILWFFHSKGKGLEKVSAFSSCETTPITNSPSTHRAGWSLLEDSHVAMRRY